MGRGQENDNTVDNVNAAAYLLVNSCGLIAFISVLDVKLRVLERPDMQEWSIWLESYATRLVRNCTCRASGVLMRHVQESTKSERTCACGFSLGQMSRSPDHCSTSAGSCMSKGRLTFASCLVHICIDFRRNRIGCW